MMQNKWQFLRKLLLAAASGLILCGAAVLGYGLMALGDNQGQRLEPPLDQLKAAWAPEIPLSESSVFADCAYFQPAYAERYEQYQARYSQYSAEEVVSRVNMDLDRPFYDESQLIEDTEAFPLLVNKYHYLPTDYKPIDLVQVVSEQQLNAQATEAFKMMEAAAGRAGHPLNIITAYRSIGEQTRLYQSYVTSKSLTLAEQLAARPGYSEHHTGYALDISAANEAGAFGETAAYDWVTANCWQYGFIIRYPQGEEAVTGYQFEPWHITFVGKEAAQTMHDRQIKTLEEYMMQQTFFRAIAADT